MEAIEIYKTTVKNSLQKNGGRIPQDLMPKTKEQSVAAMFNFPKEYYNSMKVKTIDEALNSNVCSLVLLKKEAGELSLRSALVYILTDLVLFFNIGKTMNEYQIAETADLIIDEFYYLKFDELKFCFNNAKKGVYGEVFGIDGSVIFKWLNQYVNERDECCVDTAIEENKKDAVKDEFYSDFMKRLENRFNAR